MRTIIQNGALVREDGVFSSDIAVENGKIINIAPSLPAGAGDEVINASGLLVFPGFIDAHVHFDMENALGHTSDDFSGGTRAAIAGGTTTIIHFATQEKGHTLCEALEACHRLAEGNCACDYAFHMSVTDWNERTKSELDGMFERGVSSFKLYLAYDDLRVTDAEVYEILTECAKRGGIVGVHCENGDLVKEGVKREKALGRFDPSAHPASRPPLVEAEAIHRLLCIARMAGAPVSIVHLSSREGLEEIRRAREKGQRVYVETCPQYLLLNDERYREPDFGGAKYVCSPPLRSESDRLALVGALTGGEIDTVATDHCSYTLAQKAQGLGDFSRIPNGLPGVEHRPKLLYTAFVEPGLLCAPEMCRLLSTNPAKRFGMYPRKGALQIGADADIVLWNPEAKGVIRAADAFQTTDYTPYEGMAYTGGAERVLLGGETVFMEGTFLDDKRGRYVFRNPVKEDVL